MVSSRQSDRPEGSSFRYDRTSRRIAAARIGRDANADVVSGVARPGYRAAGMPIDLWPDATVTATEAPLVIVTLQVRILGDTSHGSIQLRQCSPLRVSVSEPSLQERPDWVSLLVRRGQSRSRARLADVGTDAPDRRCVLGRIGLALIAESLPSGFLE